MDKPREFFIQNPYKEISTATKVQAFDPEANPQIIEEIHVIEYSAYEQLQKRFEEAVEVIRHYSTHHSTDIEYHKWDAYNLKLIPMGRFSDKAKEFLRSLDKEK